MGGPKILLPVGRVEIFYIEKAHWSKHLARAHRKSKRYAQSAKLSHFWCAALLKVAPKLIRIVSQFQCREGLGGAGLSWNQQDWLREFFKRL